MRKPIGAVVRLRGFQSTASCSQDASRAVVDIKNATFYRRYPSANESSATNPALFPNLSFSLSGSQTAKPQYWSVISSSSLARTTFLQILAGQHVCVPPAARTYPLLSGGSDPIARAVKYVGFDAERGSSVGGTNVRGAYLSARYESRREETDFSVHDYLAGHTELNALEYDVDQAEQQAMDEVTHQLNLRSLLTMPVANLSNGQTRRARIAKALMARPELLLLDGPFMGLDPNTLVNMSKVLRQLAYGQQPRLVMSLRPEDRVPDWISHLVVLSEDFRVLAQGRKEDVLKEGLRSTGRAAATSVLPTEDSNGAGAAPHQISRDGFPTHSSPLSPGEPLVEMQGVKVAYGSKVVLGDWNQTVNGEDKAGLWWTLHRGQRAGIFGPNGSGKTTMLSLITSDHPQTYSLPIKLFGRSRLPSPGQPGISLFDIQKRMGHSSPEVHAFFPRGITVRRALQSAWADAPLAKPLLIGDAKTRVNACLRWFARELFPRAAYPTAVERLEQAFHHDTSVTDDETVDLRSGYEHALANDEDLSWTDDLRFHELTFSAQRLLLFLRAIVSNPDLVILDEALSGIDETTRDKALLFLSHGEHLSLSSTTGQQPPQQSAVSKLGKVVVDGLSPRQALLVISHAKEDVPGCVREWIRLPEPGEGRAPRVGTLEGPLELDGGAWGRIWGAEEM